MKHTHSRSYRVAFCRKQKPQEFIEQNTLESKIVLSHFPTLKKRRFRWKVVWIYDL